MFEITSPGNVIKLNLMTLQPQSSLFHKHKVCAEIGCANGAGNSCTS